MKTLSSGVAGAGLALFSCCVELCGQPAYASHAPALEKSTQLGEEIHWIFGSFLFAFVLTEVAKKFSELFINWKLREVDRGSNLLHLLYILALVITSWLGWSNAVARGVYDETNKGTFSFATLLSIVDFAIAVFYYTLLAGVGQRRVTSSRLPSLRHVLLWTAIIFAGYCTWDILVALESNQRLGQYVWVHVIRSGLTASLAVMAYLVLAKATFKRETDSLAYCTYGSLFSLLIAFRLQKVTVPLQEPLGSPFFWLSVVFLFCFAVLLAAARLKNR